MNRHGRASIPATLGVGLVCLAFGCSEVADPASQGTPQPSFAAANEGDGARSRCPCEVQLIEGEKYCVCTLSLADTARLSRRKPPVIPGTDFFWPDPPGWIGPAEGAAGTEPAPAPGSRDACDPTVQEGPTACGQPLSRPALAPVASASAQKVQHIVPVVEPAKILGYLESGEQEAMLGVYAATRAAFRQHYEKYTDAQRQELLDGLERVARGEVEGPELNREVAIRSATVLLELIGTDTTVVAPEAREIPRRLLRVHHQTKDPHIRSSILLTLGDLVQIDPPEAPEILALLAKYLTAPPDRGPDDVPPATALDALIDAGAAGVPVLRRLHEEGAVKDPVADMSLRYHARMGYPVAPPIYRPRARKP